jgi:hypothetical protein
MPAFGDSCRRCGPDSSGDVVIDADHAPAEASCHSDHGAHPGRRRHHPAALIDADPDMGRESVRRVALITVSIPVAAGIIRLLRAGAAGADRRRAGQEHPGRRFTGASYRARRAILAATEPRDHRTWFGGSF